MLNAGSVRLPLAEVGIGEGGGAGAVDDDKRFLMRARAMVGNLLWRI